MCFVCSTTYAVSAGALLAGSSGLPLTTFEQASTLSETVAAIETPDIATPDWLMAEEAARAAAQSQQRQSAPASSAGRMVVTYDVQTRGNVTASVAEFKQQANETLNDARGWSRLNVSFQEVASGGQFSLILAHPSYLQSLEPGCHRDYSCRVGRDVIINQKPWTEATPSWNAAGGSLRDYRHMVVNHETGHWLGHGHYPCGGAGQPAPVMQQQSMDLQGCTFNPWPLTHELRAPNIGR